jgi:SOS-response transcriptional repressor LexA
MRKLPLTENERDVYGYILGYISDYDYAPTLSEISTFMGSPNHQTATYYLSQLVDKGYITRERGRIRNIEIITK